MPPKHPKHPKKLCPLTWVDEFSGATLGHEYSYTICIRLSKLVRVEQECAPYWDTQQTVLFNVVQLGAIVHSCWEYGPMGGQQVSSLDDISVVDLHCQIPLNKSMNPPENVGSWNLQKR